VRSVVRRAAAVSSVVALSAVGLTWTAGSGQASPVYDVTTFGYTGSVQSWPVPPGTQTVYVSMGGGSGSEANGNPIYASALHGTVTIPSGVTSLDVRVGGAGSPSFSGASGAGGWNGGGSGGTHSSLGGGGNGGGGATDIRPQGGALASALMVAGGSGGTGGPVPGGGAQGGAGGVGSLQPGNGASGAGSDGGAGGAGGTVSGGSGNGGGSSTSDSDGAGGGGGAGWLGGAGGAGGSAWTVSFRTGGGGGGGGGLSYASPSYVTGVTQTDPQGAFVQITALELDSPGSSGSLTVGESARLVWSAGSDVTYAVTSGEVPPGFTFDGNTGTLEGRATTAGVYPFTISASAYPDGTNAVTTSSTTTLTVYPNGSASLVATAATSVTTTTATLNGTVFAGGGSLAGIQCAYGTTNPGSGFLSGTTVTATPSSVERSIDPQPTAVSCPVTSLSTGTTYYFQIQAPDGSGAYFSSTASFATSSTPASPVMSSVTDIGTTSATATGSVSATQNVTALACRIATSAAGVSAGTVVAATPSTSGAVTNLPVSCSLTGLLPSTTYYVALFATDGAGTTMSPTIRAFTTLRSRPSVSTASASGVGTTSATVSASVTPENEVVTAIFCRITPRPGNPANGTVVAATPFQLGSATATTAVTCPLTGLTPSTSYLVRVEATDRTGTAASGNVVTFTTSAASGGGGDPVPTPEPTPTPTPSPTATSAPTPSPAATSAPTPTPSLSRVVPGLTMVVDPSPGTVRRTAPVTVGSTEADAPVVRAQRNVPTRVVVRGLVPDRRVTVQVRPERGGPWRLLESARSSKSGAVTLPPLMGTRAGEFVIRTTQRGAPPGFVVLRVVR
jgi:hypothetical protein